METKIFICIIVLLAISCNKDNEECYFKRVINSDLYIHVQPYSLNEILNNEFERGLLKGSNRIERGLELKGLLHFKVRLISDKSLSDDQVRLIKRNIQSMFVLIIDGMDVQQSLTIDETSFASGNIIQYLIVFNAVPYVIDDVQMRISAGILNFAPEIVFFDKKCF